MDVKKTIDKIFEDDPIFIDRHGSMPHRPADVRFKTKDGFNDHMGFDAALPDNAVVTKEQIETIQKLMKRGYVITGHSKWPDHPTHIEILMTLKTPTGSRYADVRPDGNI